MNDISTNPKFYTYRFVSDFAVISFVVPGFQHWDEDIFDVAATDDLASYVTEPEAYHMDECWEMEIPLNEL